MLLTAMLVAHAEIDPTLALTKSLVAIRVSNPEQQLTVFAPLLELVDGLIESGKLRQQSNLPQMQSASEALREGFGLLKKIPGVNAEGDIWVVFMAPPPGSTPLFAPKDPKAPVDTTKQPPSYLILPLRDPAAFRAFLAAPHPESPKPVLGVVCGNYGVLALTGPRPNFSNIAFDIPLVSHFGIVLSFQVGNFDFNVLQANAPPFFAQLLTPVNTVLQEKKQNIKRAEVGVTMEDNDLLSEAFLLPVPGSPLDKATNSPEADGLAMEYAGYLPPNLSYCGAGGPMLPGAAGAGNNLLRIGFGILGQFMVPDAAATFTDSFNKVMAQCDQGRALGITAPAGKGTGPTTLVAIYHTSGEQAAKTAMRGFFNGLTQSRDAVMGGMLSNTVAFAMKPGAEMVSGVPVDLVTITIIPPAPATHSTTGGGNGKKAPGAEFTPPASTPITMVGRIGYLNDKMLVSFGKNSTAEMEGMLARIRLKTPGYTASPRFQTFKKLLPPKVRGFETFSTLDLSHTAANLIPDSKEKKDLNGYLSTFPSQRTVINTYQEMQPGQLHVVLRMPDEQLRYIYTLLKTAIMMAPAKPAAK